MAAGSRARHPAGSALAGESFFCGSQRIAQLSAVEPPLFAIYCSAEHYPAESFAVAPVSGDEPDDAYRDHDVFADRGIVGRAYEFGRHFLVGLGRGSGPRGFTFNP